MNTSPVAVRDSPRWLFAVSSLAIAIFASAIPTFAANSPSPNVVIQWNQAALQGVRDGTIGPPMVARALMIVHECIFDAWAAYDAKAVGTRLGLSQSGR